MLRVKGQDGFLPLGPALVPPSELDPSDYTLRTYVNGEVVQEGDGRTTSSGRSQYQLADLCRLITLEPGDVVLTRHAGQLAADGGRATSSRSRSRASAGCQTRSSSGTSISPGPGEQLAGLRQHAARRARHPEDEAERARRRREASRDRDCAASTTSACASPTSTRPPPRWAVQFGLHERRARDGRAFLACDDEPYCLELVEAGEPGHDHTGFELAPRLPRSTTPHAHLDAQGVRLRGARGRACIVADPDGRGVQLMPYRAATEVDRWPAASPGRSTTRPRLRARASSATSTA